MGSKCRRIAEVKLMEVAQIGVRTRARAALEIEASRSRSNKRRKVGAGESMVSSTPDVQLNSRKRLVNVEQNSFYLTGSEETNSARSVSSEDSSNQAAASGCSSNISSEMEEEIIDLVELEDVGAEFERFAYSTGAERRQAPPTSQLSAEDVSNDAESTVGKTDEISSRRLIPSKTPLIVSEIEDFFIFAEEDIRKRFAEKYNFDIGKDMPMDGRYEWARLKP